MITSNWCSAAIVRPSKSQTRPGWGRCWLLPAHLRCACFPAQLHLRPLLTRDCRRAQNHEVNEILGENEVEYPIQSNTDLLFQARQLAQVDPPPEEPGNKSREVDTQDVGNASPSPDSRKQPNGREVKGFFGPTVERRQNISRESFPLTHGVLRRGRVGFAGFAVGYDGAVANSPDSRPTGNLHIFIDDHSASLFLAGECFQDRTGRCPGRPYQSFGINKRAVAQLHTAITNLSHFCVHADFYSALHQLFLRIQAQVFAKLRQYHRSRMDQHHADELLRQMGVKAHCLAKEVVNCSNGFYARKSPPATTTVSRSCRAPTAHSKSASSNRSIN